MATWLLLVVGTAMASPTGAPLPSIPVAIGKMYDVEVKFKERCEATGNVEVCGRPMVRALSGQTALVSVGQIRTIGGKSVHVGYSLEVVAETVRGGKARLQALAEWSEVVGEDDNAQLRIDRGTVARSVRLGEVFRLQLKGPKQETRWVELTVREVAP